MKLPLDVRHVVLDFVHRVYGEPTEGSLGGCRVVVDDRPVPVTCVKARQHIGEELGRVSELARDIVGSLLRVAVMVDPFVTAHGLECRGITSAREKYALPLNEENVAHVARVLER